MANVADGLGTPELGEEVNSEHGFEAALARKTGNESMLEGREPTVSTSIADGLVEAGTDPARDEAGRFAAADAAEEPETPEEDEVEEETDEPDGSDELQALLEKHGGDALKALAEVETRRKNAESKIGEQGNAMGQLRRELDELRGELRARTEQPAAQQAPQQTLSTEQIEEMVEQYGGREVALWAVNNAPHLYESVHRVWRVDEPDEASDFRLDYKLHQQRIELEKATKTQPDEWVATQKQQAAINSALASVQAEATDWPTIAPHMLAALEQVPKLVAELVLSDNEEDRIAAINVVADKARLIAGGELATTAKKKQTEAATARKKSATVLSGSSRPVAEPKPEGETMTSEERHKEFKRQLMATQTTSVEEGLTYGK